MQELKKEIRRVRSAARPRPVNLKQHAVKIIKNNQELNNLICISLCAWFKTKRR